MVIKRASSDVHSASLTSHNEREELILRDAGTGDAVQSQQQAKFDFSGRNLGRGELLNIMDTDIWMVVSCY